MKYKFTKIEELEKFRYIYPLSDIKLKLEQLSYPKEINKKPKEELDDKDLVTGTPVKSVRKRGRPKKLPKPEDLNYGDKS